MIKFLFSVIILFFYCIKVNAQNTFEGSIFFLKITTVDTSYYAYHVKGDMVRIDELDKKKDIVNSLLVDLKGQKMTAMSPARKMYMKLNSNPYTPIEDKNFEIIKTNNKKSILGYECMQWRVKNKTMNTEITYWVANDNFCFFGDLLKILNRSEKQAKFFLQIPDAKCFGPLLSEERTLLRDQKMKLSVIDIKKTKLDNTLFVVPSDYKNFER
ncbi:MAG: DUF4412 domain-containing protein [Bacteroidia bacterium]|nr:DUF4412 domain-containing protein [Bacteroidia bacterium]